MERGLRAIQPQHSIRGADYGVIGEFLPDPPIPVAAAMIIEDGLNLVAHLLIGALPGGGLCSVIVSAAGHFQGGSSGEDAVPGALVDHFAELGWGLVPRMTAAFLKCHSPGAGGRFRAAERVLLPAIEQIAAQAEFLR